MRGGLRGSTRLWRRLGAVASALGFAAVAAPAAASGALIYVAPDDESSGFFCSQSQPCGLVVGINLAAEDNDEVLMAPGTYPTSAELEVMSGDPGVTIRPRDPGTRPVIASTADIALQLTPANVTVRGIEIQHDNAGAPALFALGSSRIRNVVVTSNGDTPCQVGVGTRLTDTVCHATATSGRALRMSLAGGSATSFVRNATLIASGSNGVGAYVSGTTSGMPTLDVASSIVRGESYDIETETNGTGTATVAIVSSNFATTFVDANAGVTPPGTAGNQGAEPIFTGPSYEQAPGSPTIDAGLVDAETGTTDVYGDARPQGAANDIGADEFPVAAPPPAADTTPPETTITKKPKRKSKKRSAKFTFASSEPGSTFECKLDKGGFEACGSSLKLKKLKRRKHKLEVRAVDAAGNVDATPAAHAWKVKKKRKRKG